MPRRSNEQGEVSISHNPTTNEYYVGFSTNTERHRYAIAKWPGGTAEEKELTQFYDAAGLPLSNIQNRIPRCERPDNGGRYEEVELL